MWDIVGFFKEDSSLENENQNHEMNWTVRKVEYNQSNTLQYKET